jgi:ketosteroid isomerase-like protein
MRMHRLVIAAAVVSALAVRMEATTQTADAARAIAAADARFEDALDKRDTAALEAVLTESFTWLHALDGRVDSRAAFVAQTARGMGLSRQREDATTFEDSLAVYPSTAIRVTRVRVRFKDGSRETWMRQSRVFVLDGGQWKLASAQGTRMYDGPVTTATLYESYAGVYVIDAKRTLRLDWDGNALMGTYPSGTRTQVFLKSPTDEAVFGLDHLKFELNATGRPVAVQSLRGEELIWRGERK